MVSIQRRFHSTSFNTSGRLFPLSGIFNLTVFMYSGKSSYSESKVLVLMPLFTMYLL
ncbi:hypothetical protein GALL_510870 [mine drainage metagenome]|uniref:Uncharacterized protein n=1 Tax=mine drainage metagenome TaxID=410659 RepID=A0A1J5P7W8_9ZZZZ